MLNIGHSPHSELTAVGNDDTGTRGTRASALFLHGLHNIVAFLDLAEHDVLLEADE